MKLKQTIIGVMLGLLLVVFVVGLLPVLGTTPMGDVNADGRITITDAQLIARVSAGLEPSNCASDYNRNGRTEITDALKVAQVAAGSGFHVAGSCADPSRQYVCGDVDGDGDVDSMDESILFERVQPQLECATSLD